MISSILKKIFLPNSDKRIVWYEIASYRIYWADKKYRQEDSFHYKIYYYPNRVFNKYKLVCTPELIEFWPAPKKYAVDMPCYHEIVEKKLLDFKSGKIKPEDHE